MQESGFGRVSGSLEGCVKTSQICPKGWQCQIPKPKKEDDDWPNDSALDENNAVVGWNYPSGKGCKQAVYVCLVSGKRLEGVHNLCDKNLEYWEGGFSLESVIVPSIHDCHNRAVL